MNRPEDCLQEDVAVGSGDAPESTPAPGADEGADALGMMDAAASVRA